MNPVLLSQFQQSCRNKRDMSFWSMPVILQLIFCSLSIQQWFWLVRAQSKASKGGCRRLATSQTCLLWIPYQLGEGFVLETRFLFICGVKAGNITVNVHKYKRKFVVVVVFRQKINNQSVLFFNFIQQSTSQAFCSLVFFSMLPICLAVCLVHNYLDWPVTIVDHSRRPLFWDNISWVFF